MASAHLPSFHFRNSSSWRRRPSDHRRAPRCHGGIGDEENQKDIVEANLTVLRARMEDLRKKERRIPLPPRRGGLEFDNGRSYPSMSEAKLDRGFDRKIVKNFALISGCLEVMTMVGAAFGLVLVGGSLGICLVSLLVRHSCWWIFRHLFGFSSCSSFW